MKTTAELAQSSTPSSLQGIITALKIGGWLGFWLQIIFGVVGALTLIFAVTGRSFSEEATAGAGIGIFWSVCGLLVLLANVYLTFRYTRISKRLSNPNSALHPKKTDTIRLLRLGVVIGLAGLLLAILGAGAAVGLLLAKAVSIPQVSAFYQPNRIIRPLDVFVAMANLNGITAHFTGTVASIWLLDRVTRS